MITLLSFLIVFVCTLPETPSAFERDACAVPLVDTVKDADVIIGGLFNIHERGASETECGSRINPDAIQRLEAFIFATRYLNEQQFLSNVKFGALAYDTCGGSYKAVKRTMEMLARRDVTDDNSCSPGPLLLGVVGPMYSTPTKAVASLLTSSRLNQISYGARSVSLSDKHMYPYFTRVVPDVSHLAQAILDIVKSWGWSAVTLIVQDTEEAQEIKDLLIDTSGAAHVCIFDVLLINNNEHELPDVIKSLLQSANNGVNGIVLLTLSELTRHLLEYLRHGSAVYPSLNQLKFILGLTSVTNIEETDLKFLLGSVFVEEYYEPIPSFQDYFLNVEPTSHKINPWFMEYWQQVNNCTVNQTCSDQHKTIHSQTFSQARFVSQTISAVLTFAQGLRDAHLVLCGNTSGICPVLAGILPEQFTNFIRKVKVSSYEQLISFDNSGDWLNPNYMIHSIQSQGSLYHVNLTGTWTHLEGLHMTSLVLSNSSDYTSSSYTQSTCTTTCMCWNELNDDTYGKQDGDTVDMFVVGIFDIHDQGKHGAECDKNSVNEAAIQALEAFYFAINQINSNPNILPNMQVGSIVFDSCRSSSRILRQMSKLMNGQIKLEGRLGRDLTPRAVIGAATSHVTMALAKALEIEHIPVISYAATNPELSNKEEYPYFMRTVSPDDAQARAVVKVLKTFEWDYVTVFYSDSPYGRNIFSEFTKLTDSENICIASQIKLEQYIVEDVRAMINLAKYYIDEGFPQSRVIVLFTSDTESRALMSAYKSQLHEAIGEVVWVGTDGWGSRLKVVDDLETVALGSITIAFYAEEIPRFLHHMMKKNPRKMTENPWYSEFWQQHFDCYISDNNRHMYQHKCNYSETFVNHNLKMADSVPYVIDSVYTFAVGMDHLILDRCKNDSGVPCLKTRDKSDELYNQMQHVDFYNGITHMNVSYDVLGNAPPRYNILNFRYDEVDKQYAYIRVGHWVEGIVRLDNSSVTSYLNLNGTPISANHVTSSCDTCLCSNLSVSSIQYELQYARLTLIGYFPIHGPGPERCRNFRNIEGFLQFMAFKYAIERVNRDGDILGNNTLGYVAFDTCSDPEQAKLAYRSWQSGLRFFTQKPQVPVITYAHAFIGGYDDNVTTQLNEANQDGQYLVQISPGSQADYLSDDDKHNFLLRTVPPHSAEFSAITDVMLAMQWTYISIVYEEETAVYYQHLRNFLEEKGICVATDINISRSEIGKYALIIDELLSHRGAVGVMSLLKPGTMRKLLSAAEDIGTAGRLIWVGTDLWGKDPSVYESMVETMKGAIIFLPQVTEDPFFDSYMHTKSPETDIDNPWMKEFWQEHFQCDLKYPGKFGHTCSGQETLTGSEFKHHPIVTRTIQAVYSYAYGITKLFNDKCGEVVIPPCSAVIDPEKNPGLAHYYIRTATIPGQSGNLDKVYEENGDGVGRFNILNFHMRNYENLTGFVQIGEWISNKLYINSSMIHMYTRSGDVVHVKSECPGTCNCSRPLLRDRLDTENVPILFTAHDTVWGIIVITVLIVGIIFTLIVFLFFVFKFDDPVVTAATLSLSTIILIGLFLMYVLNFAFMTSPTLATCGCRRVGLGLTYAIVFSCLLVKAIRINQVHNRASLSGQPYCVSGLSQAIVALLCISVEVVLVAEWLVLKPPEVTWTLVNINPDGFYPLYDVQWRCVHSDQALVISLVYVYILTILTLIMALKAHKATEFYKEALYIIITTVCSIIIMISWAAILIKGNEQLKTPAVCCGITLNASLILGLIFLPKILVLTDNRPKKTSGNIQAESNYAIPERRRDKKKLTEDSMTTSVIERRQSMLAELSTSL